MLLVGQPNSSAAHSMEYCLMTARSYYHGDDQHRDGGKNGGDADERRAQARGDRQSRADAHTDPQAHKAPTIRTLAVSAIHKDSAIQPRQSCDPATVEHYAERMRAGDTFPPLDVFGNEHLLASGYHRLQAAEQIGRKTIEIRVHRGDRRVAILFAANANAHHGLPMSNDDKHRIVARLLGDEE